MPDLRLHTVQFSKQLRKSGIWPAIATGKYLIFNCNYGIFMDIIVYIHISLKIIHITSDLTN